MSSNVVNLDDARRPIDSGYDGLVCECGSSWFDATVTFGPDTPDGRSISGYVLTEIVCTECHKMAQP